MESRYRHAAGSDTGCASATRSGYVVTEIELRGAGPGGRNGVYLMKEPLRPLSRGKLSEGSSQ